MINVLIVDDHVIVQKGLREILSTTSDIRIIDDAGNGKDALELIQENKYDVILLDISLPDKNGIEVLKLIKSSHPKLPVLMLSAASEEEYALRALKTGASGYIHKQSAPEQLIDAVRLAASGKKYVSAHVAEELANAIDPEMGEPRELHHTLSNREYETLRMIASGKKLSDIAEAMSLSPKTVSIYRSRMMEKMRFKTNAEIIRYAVSHKLIE